MSDDKLTRREQEPDVQGFDFTATLERPAAALGERLTPVTPPVGLPIVAASYRRTVVSPVPCRESADLVLDRFGFPVGLMVDSVNYRVRTCLGLILRPGWRVVPLTLVRSCPAINLADYLSEKIDERKQLLRRELAEGTRRSARAVAGYLLRDVRHRYRLAGHTDPDTAAREELAAEFGEAILPKHR